MASLDELPPDQRATLQLLLKQGRSYDEIATMLRIEPRAVRERARAALDALGPEDVEDLELDDQDDIADYLLGQQSASRRAATRELLASSPGGRAWARVVAGELRPLAGDDGLPDVPADAAEVEEAFDALGARAAHREKTERSSRVGGALLLGALAIVLVAVILLATGAIGGDDDDGGGDTETTAQTTATTPTVERQINLEPPEGRESDAQGVAQVARQGDQRAVALVAQGLPAANESRFYAIWLYSSPSKAKRLGFPNPQPDENGRIETGFEMPADAGEYKELVVSRESTEDPKSPTRIELRGPLAGTAPAAGGSGG
jgi:hypothetical protein